MTKREFVWLLIRLAGVYFAYLAIITFFTVVTSGWSLIFAPPKLDVPNANSNRAAPIPGIVQPAPYDINNPTATSCNFDDDRAGKTGRQSKARSRDEFSGRFVSGFDLRRNRILFSARRQTFVCAFDARRFGKQEKPYEPEVTTLNL